MTKGISLPINIVVIMAVAILVLVVAGTFFISQSSEQFSTLDATVQAQRCRERLSCSSVRETWQVDLLAFVRQDDDFSQRCLNACKSIFPGVQEPYQCLQQWGCDLGSREEVEELLKEDLDDLSSTG